MAELKDFKVMEVSLVPKAANRRKFLLLKSDKNGGEKMADMGEVLEAIGKDFENEEEIDELLKSEELTEEGKKAAKAALRILKEHGEELPQGIIGKLMQAAGMEDDYYYEPPENNPGGRGDRDREIEGRKEANPDKDNERNNPEGEEEETGNPAHLEPGMRIRLSDDRAGVIAQYDGENGRALVAFAEEGESAWVDVELIEEVVARGKTEKAGGADKEMIAKTDLEGLPEEVKTSVEALWKEHKEAVKKAEELEETLKKERDERLKKEFIQKAEKEFKHLPVKADEFGLLLKSMAAKLDTDEYQRLTDLLGSVEETIREGEILKERGSDGSLPTGGVMERIEAQAKEMVQKSDGELTKEQAVSKILSMDKNLYEEYINEVNGR